MQKISEEDIKRLQKTYSQIIIDWVEDDNSFCDVCMIKEDFLNDKLVFCELCECLIHQSCYGSELLEKVPDGQWFCMRCQDLIKYDLKNNGQFKKDFESEYMCQSCPQLKGALKKIYVQTNTSNNKNLWYHIKCIDSDQVLLEFIPNGKKEAAQRLYSSQKTNQQDSICNVCKIQYGKTQKCFESTCNFHFHISCGKSQGTIRNLEIMMKYKDPKTQQTPLYCFEHLKQKFQEDPDNFEAQYNNALEYKNQYEIYKDNLVYYASEQFLQTKKRKNEKNNQELERSILGEHNSNKKVNMGSKKQQMQNLHQKQTDIKINLNTSRSNEQYYALTVESSSLWELFKEVSPDLDQYMPESEWKEQIAYFFVHNDCLDYNDYKVKIIESKNPKLYDVLVKQLKFKDVIHSIDFYDIFKDKFLIEKVNDNY